MTDSLSCSDECRKNDYFFIAFCLCGDWVQMGYNQPKVNLKKTDGKFEQNCKVSEAVQTGKYTL